MLLQNILLGFILATLYGAAFHLYKGGSIWRLLLYIAFAWIGFWGGHFIADLLGWTFLRVGTLNIGMATLTCLLVLVLGYWLSLVQVDQKSKKS